MMVTDNHIVYHKDNNYQQSRSDEINEEKSGEGQDSEL